MPVTPLRLLYLMWHEAAWQMTAGIPLRAIRPVLDLAGRRDADA